MDWWRIIVMKPIDYATLPTWEGQTGPWAPSYFVEVPQYRTWDAWCAGLRARFEPIMNSIAARQRLRTWRQLGSVQDYTSGFLALCEQVGYMHEGERIDHYIGSLKHEIPQEIHLRNVTEFHYILAMAEKLDFFADREQGPTATTYNGIFPEDLQEGLPPQQPHDHRIELEPGAQLTVQRQFRLTQPKLDKLRKQLDYPLKKKIIRLCSSPFAAPILFTPKKDGALPRTGPSYH
ncbi:unnamed protein product [Closterium sp. NIES-53]